MEQELGSRYLIGGAIGRGAMGRVYLGTRRSDGEAVAVKVLREELVDDPDLVSRFLQERSTLLSLRSPYLVAIEDFVVEGDTLAIVMPFLGHGDLRTLLKTAGRLELDDALRLTEEVLLGLEVVHDAGVVHRDIKPENVLLDLVEDRWHARVTDFGIARVGTGPLMTGLYDYLGTPGYQAPEIGRGCATTPAADVYSVGVMLYELVLGGTPYGGPDGPLAILRRQDTEDPPWPGELPAPLRGLLATMLSRSPDARPADAEAAYAALVDVHEQLRVEGLVQDGPVPPPDGPHPRDARTVHRRGPAFALPAAPAPVDAGRPPAPETVMRGRAPQRAGAAAPAQGRGRVGLRSRRTLALLAASAVVLAGAGAGVVLRGPDSSATPATAVTLPFAMESYLDGAVQVSRTWRLDPTGSHLRGELVVVAGDDVTAAVDEVLPKSVAGSAHTIRFTPAPAKVVADDPVVRYQIALKGGQSATYRYDVPVAKGPVTLARLQGWASDQYDEQGRYLTSTQRTPATTLASVSLAPTTLPLVGDTSPHQLALSGTLLSGAKAPSLYLRHASFTSSAVKVATVDDSGVVTAHGNGAATITAILGRLSAQTSVLVSGRATGSSAGPSGAPARRVVYIAPPATSAPQPPAQVVAAAAQDGRVAVLWSSPPDGGSPIRRFTVTLDGLVVAITQSPSVVLSGLSTNRVVQFRVSAGNALGDSPPSEPSSPIVVGGPAQVLCTPTQPQAVSPSLTGPTSARVTWTLPAGEEPCVSGGFSVSTVPAKRTITVPAGQSSADISGLGLDGAYAFEVTALYGNAPSQTGGRSAMIVTGLTDRTAIAVLPVPSGEAGVAVLHSAAPGDLEGGLAVQPESVVPPAVLTTPLPTTPPVPDPVEVVVPVPTDPVTPEEDTPAGLDTGGTTVVDPTTDPPTVDPTTDPPTADPTTDPPTADPTTDPPTADPTTDPPTADPTTDPPTADPTTDPPTADPTTDPPTADPTTDPPTADPTTDPPTTDPPSTGAGTVGS